MDVKPNVQTWSPLRGVILIRNSYKIDTRDSDIYIQQYKMFRANLQIPLLLMPSRPHLVA